jgi:NitT/TauT family transport system ATP-binding protein
MTVAARTLPQPVASPQKSAVRVEGVSLTLPDRNGRNVSILDVVDLAVEAGEFVSIVGPSGCGKSTLLNCIAGLRQTNSGRIEVLGRPSGQPHPDIGYMFQAHALFPWRSVLENTEITLELSGVSKPERRSRCRQMLAKVGLGGFEDHYPGEISGGMRQRVSLARMLVSEPSLLLMDEPFGALDAQTKLLVQELFLASWEEQRRTVLFVTHDLAEAIVMSDRIVVMSARPGRIVQEYQVGLPRPRDLAQVRSSPRYIQLWDALWRDLRSEALQAMQEAAR